MIPKGGQTGSIRRVSTVTVYWGSGGHLLARRLVLLLSPEVLFFHDPLGIHATVILSAIKRQGRKVQRQKTHPWSPARTCHHRTPPRILVVSRSPPNKSMSTCAASSQHGRGTETRMTCAEGGIGVWSCESFCISSTEWLCRVRHSTGNPNRQKPAGVIES